jgi:hypothetical protein
MMTTDPGSGEQCELDLKFRLDGTDWYDDQAFAEYGHTDQEISSLRRWAQSWSDDINRRLYAETYVDDEDEEIP